TAIAEAQSVPAEEIAQSLIARNRTTLLERFLEPAEIANLIVFLSIPKSSATNGTAVRAGGGVLASMLCRPCPWRRRADGGRPCRWRRPVAGRRSCPWRRPVTRRRSCRIRGLSPLYGLRPRREQEVRWPPSGVAASPLHAQLREVVAAAPVAERSAPKGFEILIGEVCTHSTRPVRGAGARRVRPAPHRSGRSRRPSRAVHPQRYRRTRGPPRPCRPRAGPTSRTARRRLRCPPRPWPRGTPCPSRHGGRPPRPRSCRHPAGSRPPPCRKRGCRRRPRRP